MEDRVSRADGRSWRIVDVRATPDGRIIHRTPPVVRREMAVLSTTPDAGIDAARRREGLGEGSTRRPSRERGKKDEDVLSVVSGGGGDRFLKGVSKKEGAYV